MISKQDERVLTLTESILQEKQSEVIFIYIHVKDLMQSIYIACMYTSISKGSVTSIE